MAIREWGVAKDINTQVDSGQKTGRGGSDTRYIGKGSGNEYFRMLVEFDRDFTGMEDGRILTARVYLTTNEGPGGWFIGSEAGIIAHRLTEEFSDDSDSDFHTGGYDNPTADTGKTWAIRTGIPTTQNVEFSFDVISYIQQITPRNIDVLIGTTYVAGSAKTDHGLRLRSTDEGRSAEHVLVWSGAGSAPANKRPRLVITWEPKNTKPDTTWSQPTGSAASDTPYTGTYFDPQGQTIKAAQVQVWRSTDNDPDDGGTDDHTRFDSGKVARQGSWPDDQYVIPPPATPLPKKASNGSTITYRGRARTWDSKDLASDWTSLASGQFTVGSTTPTVAATASGSHSTLENVHFRAPWTFDPTALRVSSYRVQFTVRSDDDVWAQVFWDKVFVPTAAEVSASRADFIYGGPNLAAGNYSWRIMVTDGLGEVSDWAEDETLVLTVGTTEPDDPNDTTVYGRGAVTTRIVMRAVDEDNDRRPGSVVAIIEDPSNLAVSVNASSPGQLSFSLPNRHPQVAAMEPMRTHWSLQQYRGSQWKELAGGLLTDFDATENDTIFFGLDYIGVLGLSIESKSQPSDNAEASWAANGAKYTKKTISFIIKDQLERAIAAGNSPVGFFTIPGGAVDTMSEQVTIHAAYVQRLDFIRGLLDSHRGGATGRRSRITAAKNPLNDDYEFTVRSNAGKDRTNLVLSYGSMVQAYRVMALGDWADKVYGVGRKRNELKPFYANFTAPGISLADWGEIAKASVWQDLSDSADLQRRARQMATESSRAGKRIALGLRVAGLLPLDGWNICDNIRIDIEHGTVSTSAYGTDGWWTIWGWEWRLYPDGHDELTLVTRPREDISEPVEDLIPSQPIHIQPEWTVAHGPP